VCPEDGFELNDQFPDMSCFKEIMLLACFCKHKNKDCLWSGALAQLEDHMQVCNDNADPPLVASEATEHSDETPELSEVEKLLKDIRGQQQIIYEKTDNSEKLSRDLISILENAL